VLKWKLQADAWISGCTQYVQMSKGTLKQKKVSKNNCAPRERKEMTYVTDFGGSREKEGGLVLKRKTGST